MKRTLALFLTLCMALSMFSFPAFAAEADVAVLDEAALVETETNNGPVAEVPAPAEAVEAPVAAAVGIQFKNNGVGFSSVLSTAYSAAKQTLNTVLANVTAEVTGTEATVTKTEITVDLDPTVHTAFDALTLNADKYSLTNVIDEHVVNVKLTLSDGSSVSGLFQVTVSPATVAYTDLGDVTTSADYGNVVAGKPTLTGAAANGVTTEAQSGLSVEFYTDSYGTPANKVDPATLTTKIYKELYYKVVAAENSNITLSHSTAGAEVGKVYPLAQSKNTSFADATGGFAPDKYTFAYDGAKLEAGEGKDIPYSDMVFTGDYADLGALTNDVGAGVSFKYVVKKGTDLSTFDWSAGGATDGLPKDVGTYYVQAILTDDITNAYVNGTNVKMTPAEVEITKAAAPTLKLVYGAENKALDGAKIPFSATGSTPGTVDVSAVFSIAGVTPTFTIEGTNIGFAKTALQSYMPSLPGTYVVKAEVPAAADGSYGKMTATARFEIVPADADVVVAVNSDLTTATKRNAIIKTADCKTYFAGSTDDIDAAFANAATYVITNNTTGKQYDATDSGEGLPAGTYTVVGTVTPTDFGVAGDGYNATTVPSVKTVNTSTGSATFTVTGTANTDSAVLTGKIANANLTWNSKIVDTEPVSLLESYNVTVDSVDVTPLLGSEYELGYVYCDTQDGTYAAADSISKPGYYQVYAYTEKDGVKSPAPDDNTAYATLGFYVAPGLLDIVYTPLDITTDGVTDHYKDLTYAAFKATDKISGENVVLNGTNVKIEGAAVSTPVVDQKSYAFKATFNIKDAGNTTLLYAKGGVAYTYEGDVVVKGKNDATVAFKVRDPQKTYDGKALAYTEKDLTLSANISAEPTRSLSFVYEKLNEKTGKYAAAANTSDAGTYKVTVYLAANTTAGTNAAQDTIYVTVNPAKPTVTLDSSTNKDTTFTADKAPATWPTVSVKDVANQEIGNGVQVKHFYKDGVLITDAKGEPDTTVVPDGLKEPGKYTMTVQWMNWTSASDKTPIQLNYTDSDLVTSATFTLVSKAAAADQIPTLPSLTAKYGDEKNGLAVGTVTGQTEPDKLNGDFRIVEASGKISNAPGETFEAKLEFVPSNKAYGPVAVPGWQTVEVEEAEWTDDDVEIVGTTLEQLDGKPHALTSFSYTPKFESDRPYLKVTYSADGGKTWVDDITKATRTTSGLVQIKIVDTRDPKMYKDKIFLGSIKLGNSKVSTLVLADTTAVYTDDGSKLAPQLVIKTEGVADIKVPASDLKYEYAPYTDSALAAAYQDASGKSLGDLHYAEKPYWVRASIKPAALSKYGDFNFGDNASLTAYATYTVEKLKLDETKLGYTINTTVKLTTKYVDDTTYVDGITLAEVGGNNNETSFPVKKPNTAKDAIKGDWDWKAGSNTAVRDAYADYSIVFTVDDPSKLTKGGNCAEGDYVNPTVTLHPTVTPKEIKVTTAPVVTPETVPYGTTLGDLKVDATDAELNGVDLEGIWVWAEGNEYVMPVGKHTEDSSDASKTAGEKAFVLAFRANEKPLNYNIAADITVEVTKGEPTLVVTNTTMAYTGNPASLKIETNNNETEPKITWYDAKGNTMYGAPTQIGKYKVKVSLGETANFLAKSVTVDYEITYNQTGIEGFVYRLYSVALGREPDQSGYTMWVNLLKSKEYTPKTVAEGFIFSPEFTNRKYDNATFLKVMYKTFMDREPDASGYAMWLKGLNSGEYTREFVFNGFADSKEFTNICKRFGL